jgi:hypothetical protein
MIQYCHQQERIMTTVRLSATIGDDRKLTVHVPDEIPTGPVDVVIHAHEISASAMDTPREIARRKLQMAGILATDLGIPDDLAAPSEVELETQQMIIQQAALAVLLFGRSRGQTFIISMEVMSGLVITALRLFSMSAEAVQ